MAADVKCENEPLDLLEIVRRTERLFASQERLCCIELILLAVTKSYTNLYPINWRCFRCVRCLVDYLDMRERERELSSFWKTLYI